MSLPLTSEFSCRARAGASLSSDRAARRQLRQNEGAVKKKPPTVNMRVITSTMQMMICFAQNRSSSSAGAWCHNQDEEIVIKVVFCSEVNCKTLIGSADYRIVHFCMICCTFTKPHTLLSNVSLVTPMMHLLCNVTKTEQEALHNVARDTSSCGIIKTIYQFQVDGRLRKSDSR